MAVEFELKYRATPAVLEAIAREYPRLEELRMETAYYDTPEGTLAQRKMTLRCRRENHRQVCTLKAPADRGARGEWEMECGDIRQAAEPLLTQSGLQMPSQLLSRELLQVCGARFVRRAALIKTESCVMELALDQGVLLGGGAEQALCEVEVEHKAGSRKATVRFARQLARRYGLVPENTSKFRRALALAKGEENGPV